MRSGDDASQISSKPYAVRANGTPKSQEGSSAKGRPSGVDVLVDLGVLDHSKENSRASPKSESLTLLVSGENSDTRTGSRFW